MDTWLRLFQALLVTLLFKINLPLTLHQKSLKKKKKKTILCNIESSLFSKQICHYNVSLSNASRDNIGNFFQRNEISSYCEDENTPRQSQQVGGKAVIRLFLVLGVPSKLDDIHRHSGYKTRTFSKQFLNTKIIQISESTFGPTQWKVVC